MKLLVTGASSFVGAHFCSLAARRGFDTIGVWRNTALTLAGVRSLHGDVTTLTPPPGVDAVIHLAAKVMADDAIAQNRRMLDAVLGWGRPVVYCSSTVVHWKEKNDYARSRMEDEARVKSSGLPYLIVRPCAPYGPKHGEHTPQHRESFHLLAALVMRLPIIPLIGDGSYRRQPVHVDDFNGAILNLIQKGAWNNAYDSGGPEPHTFKEVVQILGQHAGRKVRTASMPLSLAIQAAKVVPGFHPDVFKTFTSDDVVDARPLQEASGLTPRSFRDGAACLYWG